MKEGGVECGSGWGWGVVECGLGLDRVECRVGWGIQEVDVFKW